MLFEPLLQIVSARGYTRTAVARYLVLEAGWPGGAVARLTGLAAKDVREALVAGRPGVPRAKRRTIARSGSIVCLWCERTVEVSWTTKKPRLCPPEPAKKGRKAQRVSECARLRDLYLKERRRERVDGVR